MNEHVIFGIPRNRTSNRQSLLETCEQINYEMASVLHYIDLDDQDIICRCKDPSRHIQPGLVDHPEKRELAETFFRTYTRETKFTREDMRRLREVEIGDNSIPSPETQPQSPVVRYSESRALSPRYAGRSPRIKERVPKYLKHNPRYAERGSRSTGHSPRHVERISRYSERSMRPPNPGSSSRSPRYVMRSPQNQSSACENQRWGSLVLPQSQHDLPDDLVRSPKIYPHITGSKTRREKTSEQAFHGFESGNLKSLQGQPDVEIGRLMEAIASEESQAEAPAAEQRRVIGQRRPASRPNKKRTAWGIAQEWNQEIGYKLSDAELASLVEKCGFEDADAEAETRVEHQSMDRRKIRESNRSHSKSYKGKSPGPTVVDYTMPDPQSVIPASSKRKELQKEWDRASEIFSYSPWQKTMSSSSEHNSQDMHREESIIACSPGHGWKAPMTQRPRNETHPNEREEAMTDAPTSVDLHSEGIQDLERWADQPSFNSWHRPERKIVKDLREPQTPYAEAMEDEHFIQERVHNEARKDKSQSLLSPNPLYGIHNEPSADPGPEEAQLDTTMLSPRSVSSIDMVKGPNTYSFRKSLSGGGFQLPTLQEFLQKHTTLCFSSCQAPIPGACTVCDSPFGTTDRTFFLHSCGHYIHEMCLMDRFRLLDQVIGTCPTCHNSLCEQNLIERMNADHESIFGYQSTRINSLNCSVSIPFDDGYVIKCDTEEKLSIAEFYVLRKYLRNELDIAWERFTLPDTELIWDGVVRATLRRLHDRNLPNDFSRYFPNREAFLKFVAWAELVRMVNNNVHMAVQRHDPEAEFPPLGELHQKFSQAKSRYEQRREMWRRNPQGMWDCDQIATYSFNLCMQTFPRDK